MRNKLIVLDIDGTLVGASDRVSARTAAAVTKARQLGAVVTIATGRRLRSTLQIAEQLGISLPLILYNGSLITQSDPFATIHVQTLSFGTVQRLIELIHSEGQAAFAYLAPGTPPDVFYQTHLPIHDRYVADTEYVSRVEDLSIACRGRDIVRVMTWGARSDVDRIAELASRKFGPHETTIIASDYVGHRNLEFFPPGATKARAIALLSARLGVSANDVIAIGDGINDIEMIESAGIGIAMGNACEEVKRIAARITAPVDQDGVALALEQLMAEAL